MTSLKLAISCSSMLCNPHGLQMSLYNTSSALMCSRCVKFCYTCGLAQCSSGKKNTFFPVFIHLRSDSTWKVLKAHVGSAEGWQTARQQQACDRRRLSASMTIVDLKKIRQCCLKSLYDKWDQSSSQQSTPINTTDCMKN